MRRGRVDGDPRPWWCRAPILPSFTCYSLSLLTPPHRSTMAWARVCRLWARATGARAELRGLPRGAAQELYRSRPGPLQHHILSPTAGGGRGPPTSWPLCTRTGSARLLNPRRRKLPFAAAARGCAGARAGRREGGSSNRVTGMRDALLEQGAHHPQQRAALALCLPCTHLFPHKALYGPASARESSHTVMLMEVRMASACTSADVVVLSTSVFACMHSAADGGPGGPGLNHQQEAPRGECRRHHGQWPPRQGACAGLGQS